MFKNGDWILVPYHGENAIYMVDRMFEEDVVGTMCGLQFCVKDCVLIPKRFRKKKFYYAKPFLLKSIAKELAPTIGA